MSQQEEIEQNRLLAQQLQIEARDASQLANQMKAEASQAYMMAEVAKTVQQKALILKEEALKDKNVAQKKAAEALAARLEAEKQKEQAFEAMKVARIKKQKAEEKALQLATTIQDIKQDGGTAYINNILPQIQILNVSYIRNISNEVMKYERELTLLPFKLGEDAFVVFSSRQIGFSARSDRAPDELILLYKGQEIGSGWINKNDDLIALELPDYEGVISLPYSVDIPVDELMPALLALRNNGNVSLVDKIRGIADDYFIVNRDYLKSDKEYMLNYNVKGFRGTGTRGERIIRGDQLIDLNGRLIGVANDANRVLRINSLSGWDKVVF